MCATVSKTLFEVLSVWVGHKVVIVACTPKQTNKQTNKQTKRGARQKGKTPFHVGLARTLYQQVVSQN